jgi:hypothetical protein
MNKLVIIGLAGAGAIALYLFYKKYKASGAATTASGLANAAINTVNQAAAYQLPAGITNGMHVKGNGANDNAQYIIKDNKKYYLSYETWVARGFDPFTVVDTAKLSSIPEGGLFIS